MSTQPKIAKKSIPGLVTASILAVLTLGAFYILQEYGPVSAVRRFHMALARGDKASEQQVIDEPVKDESVQYLEKIVGGLIGQGVQPQLARMDSQGDQDDVAVVYHLPDGGTLAIIWIVERKKSIWKIDAHSTATALYQSLHGSEGQSG